MDTTARFEVVHTGPHQFHARLRYGNGEVGWTTETFTRRRAAIKAIGLLFDVVVLGSGLPIREVDER